jgi:transposase
MPKSPVISIEKRGIIVAMFKIGLKAAEIARKTNIGDMTVRSVIKRYQASGSLTSAPRSGRPPLLDDRDSRRLTQIVKKNRKVTLTDIHGILGVEASKRTLQRRLLKLDLKSRIAIKKPFISKINARRRVMWCRSRRNWTVKEWKRVIWSDECSIQLWQGSRATRVRRMRSERLNLDCLAPTVKHGRGKLMIWACFSWDRLGPIKVIKGSVDRYKYVEILENGLLPFWRQRSRRFQNPIFQDDGAKVHRAKYVENWKKSNRIVSLPWAAQSPDLNPIEHIWHILKMNISKRKPKPKNLKELEVAIYEEWGQLQKSLLRKLIYSMPRRLRSVILAKGYPTKY